MTRKARAQKNAPQMRQKARQAVASRLSELRMLCAACVDIEHRLSFAQVSFVSHCLCMKRV